jgi:hypothetical protein
MKRFMLSLGMSLLCTTLAVAKDKPEGLQGHWKSVAASGLKKDVLPITDTILLDFRSETEYTWTKGQYGIPMRGNYAVDKNGIDLGMTVLELKSRDDQQMTVQIENTLYTFQRYTPAAVVEDNRNASVGDRMRKTELYTGVYDVSLLTGKWKIYKRESFVKGDVAYSRIVRLVDIPATPGADGKKGWVYAANDGAEAASWYIDKIENSTLYCKGKGELNFKVLKCDGKELVFEDDTYRYYCKQFSL